MASLASSPLSSIKRPNSGSPPQKGPTDKSSSSFAAALRNLAKNASSVANDLPATSSSMISAVVASPIPASLPLSASTSGAGSLQQQTQPEPPALLDVRRVSHKRAFFTPIMLTHILHATVKFFIFWSCRQIAHDSWCIIGWLQFFRFKDLFPFLDASHNCQTFNGFSHPFLLD